MDWFFISLICAFSLASADAATKRTMASADLRQIVLLRIGAPGILLAPVALSGPLPPLTSGFWGWMLLLVPLEIVATVLYMRAIRDFPLWTTLPYLAFTPLFVVVTGWLILGERLRATGLLGIVLIGIGSWLLNVRSTGSALREIWAPLRHAARNPGARLMLLVALIYAVTSVGGKAALQWMPAARLGAFYFFVVGVTTLIVFSAARPPSMTELRRYLWPGLIVAGLSSVMIVTHFLALERIETAYMIAVKRSSLLFGIVYGALLFGETRLRQNLLAGGLMVTGIALIVV